MDALGCSATTAGEDGYTYLLLRLIMQACVADTAADGSGCSTVDSAPSTPTCPRSSSAVRRSARLCLLEELWMAQAPARAAASGLDSLAGGRRLLPLAFNTVCCGVAWAR